MSLQSCLSVQGAAKQRYLHGPEQHLGLSLSETRLIQSFLQPVEPREQNLCSLGIFKV